LSACIQNVAKNPTSARPVLECVSADVKGSIAKAAAAAGAAFASKCGGADKAGLPKLPTVGANDPNDVAVQGAVTGVAPALARTAFGDPVDPPIVALAGDKAGAKCQQAVIASLAKCFDAQLGRYQKCKKTELKFGARTAATLKPCLTRDPKDKTQQVCNDAGKPDAIRKALSKACVDKGVALAAAFPACGAGGDVESTHACLFGGLPCLACRTLSTLDELAGIDCDDVDDKTINGSCPPVP
jgi:hypothetical protein